MMLFDFIQEVEKCREDYGDVGIVALDIEKAEALLVELRQAYDEFGRSLHGMHRVNVMLSQLKGNPFLERKGNSGREGSGGPSGSA